MSPLSATYWGMPGYAIFWALFVIASGLFAWRFYSPLRLIGLGKAENRFDRIGQRIKTLLVEVVPQWCNMKTITRTDLAGLSHALLLWGFGLFLISYIIFVILAGGFGTSLVTEDATFNIAYFSILDIAGMLVTVALLLSVLKHYVIKPQRMEAPTAENAIILIVLFVFIVINIALQGFGYAVYKIDASWPLPGATLAGFLSDTGLSQGTLEGTYQGLWWLHYMIVLGLLYFPRSMHLHILTSPANVFFKSLGPKVVLKPIPLEEVETFGVAKIQDFTWKDLLDLYACSVCGRCHVNCPAQLSGKSLSPREVILNLKEHLLEAGPGLLAGKAEASSKKPAKTMLGDVVTEEEIWDCTTCGACQEVCPVKVEHVPKIIDLRRNLVLTQGKMPESVSLMLRNMQTRGHPWAGIQSLRLRGDWTSGLELKILAQDSNVDTLFWVGCTGALVERNVGVTLSLVRVLKAAGVDFGVLGEEEACCGDPARRAGYEILFQTTAEQNIQILKGNNVKKIVTACPHCYNTLKNEYPKFGADFKVVHYTQLIADLISQGRLKLTNELSSVITYHDPCYLGRYNSEYLAPRKILQSIPKTRLHEMDRSRGRSFCCGGGGGHMWLEEKIGRKSNEMRIEDALKTGAETVVTACPYCLQMLEEGIERKQVKSSLQARDIAELVEQAIKQSE